MSVLTHYLAAVGGCCLGYMVAAICSANGRESDVEKRFEPPVRCADCSKWDFCDDYDCTRYGQCGEFSHESDTVKNMTSEHGWCYWGDRRSG